MSVGEAREKPVGKSVGEASLGSQPGMSAENVSRECQSRKPVGNFSWEIREVKLFPQ
jgi:hypothetical protein